MNIKLFFFALCALFVPLSAQTPLTLSDSARISLMTVAPGDEVYSTFGHSAIRVYDPGHKIDRCFNYGTFDFDQPNFILNFCRGRLLYSLDVETYRGFEYGNLRDYRPMKEQVLRLDKEQKQRLYDLLQVNLLPENRNYKYDFFYDNCATRIREIIAETFFHQIVFDESRFQTGNTTMRDLLQPYVERKPWLDFGIDLVLGLPADKKAGARDYMFLPDGLHDVFGGTRVDGAPLVQSEKNIPDPPIKRREFSPDIFERPLAMMCIFALTGLLLSALPKTERFFFTFFWFLIGLTGLIMALLWFATDHMATKNNFNLLWALPTHLWFCWKKPVGQWARNYFLFTAFLAGSALIFWKFLPQDLPVPAIPLIGMVVYFGIRAGMAKGNTQSTPDNLA